jgi:predicted transcriptional regulator
MSKSFFTIERKVRKRKLVDLIKENPKIPEQKLKGLFSLQTGLSFKRIEQYLEELEGANLVERNSDGEYSAVL